MTLRALLLGSAMIAGCVLPSLAAELKIRSEAVVETDVVRLGQLIEGLENGADVPVFASPAPGIRGTIRVDRIIAAARELGIEGLKPGDFRIVSVIRPGRQVTRGEMQAAIGRALAERGATGTIEIILDDEIAARMVDSARAATLRVLHLGRDPRSGRFQARLAMSGAGEAESFTVTGSVLETREIVVPMSDIERGDAVQAKDVMLVKRPAALIGPDAITQLSDLVGMIPRKALRAGEPVKQTDIARPILVEKNQLITAIYISGGLRLAMRGRAMANGAMGENVRIQNTQSKRIVEGTVSGPGQVMVTAIIAPPANVAEAPTAPRPQ